MKNPHDIIIRPVITEQSMMEAAYGKYTFEVDRRASKTEIRQAVEVLFDVKVTGVNTINLRGKERRVGSGRKSMTSARKKHYKHRYRSCRKVIRQQVVKQAAGRRNIKLRLKNSGSANKPFKRKKENYNGKKL